MDKPIISRAAALALGLKRYYTGVPCCHGHDSERLVSDQKCIECNKAAKREWRKTESGKASKNRTSRRRRERAREAARGLYPLASEWRAYRDARAAQERRERAEERRVRAAERRKEALKYQREYAEGVARRKEERERERALKAANAEAERDRRERVVHLRAGNVDSLVIQQSEAQRFGLRHYYTGEPCVNGHKAPRTTEDGICIDCSAEAVALLNTTPNANEGEI